MFNFKEFVSAMNVQAKEHGMSFPKKIVMSKSCYEEYEKDRLALPKYPGPESSVVNPIAIEWREDAAEDYRFEW